MMRGGGFGGGGQLFEAFGQLGASRLDQLLMIGIGLVLIALIVHQMLGVRPAPPRRVRRSTTCLSCTRGLGHQAVYVDRYFPNWVVCDDCYDQLAPARQRQYRAERPQT